MRYLTWVFGVGFVILLTIIIGFLYSVSRGILDSGLASAATTSMLVLVTAISVYMTLLLLIENRNAREREYEPVLVLTPTNDENQILDIAIENVGNGPARSIDIMVKIYPEEMNLVSVQRENIRPGDMAHPPLLQNFEWGVDGGKGLDIDEIELVGTYEDIFGREIQIEETFDVEVLWRSIVHDTTFQKMLNSHSE